MEREEVQALIRAHRPSSGTGYPEDVRQKVVVYARQRRAKGQHWAHIGMEIGLSSTTLVNWSKPRGKVPPVAASPDGPLVAGTVGAGVALGEHARLDAFGEFLRVLPRTTTSVDGPEATYQGRVLVAGLTAGFSL